MGEQPFSAPNQPQQASAATPQFLQLAALIAELGAIWSTAADFRASLEMICAAGRDLLPADAALVLVPERDSLRVVCVRGSGADRLQDACLTPAELGPVLARAISERRGEMRPCSDPQEGVFAGEFVLAEPIAISEHAAGLLLFTRRDCTRAFGPLEQAQASLLARQAEFAYRLLRRARELQLIYEVTKAINSSLHLDEVLECIYQGVSRILPVDNFYIALWDGGDEIRFEIEVEERRRRPKRSRQRSGGLTEHLLSTRKPLLLARNVSGQREQLGIHMSGRPALSWMGAPMVFREKAVGVIALQSYQQEGVFDEQHLSVLENIAGQAACAIENARLFQQTCASLEQLQTAQQLLLQSEKLAAVGQLISGIAHELNNPLTGVVGWTQYLLSQGMPENLSRHLVTVNEQAQRAAKIVQNLLTFSRQHKPEQALVRVEEVLEDTLALRAYELRVNNIAVHRCYASDAPLISADAHQLQQVFLNLVINAEQAILSVRNSGNITVIISHEDGQVRVAIADDGPGISAGKLKKIFDPFFTTKPVGQGTGLGLSISFGIVQEHGGSIYAESEEGCGARMVVELPVAKAAATVSPVLAAPQPELKERKQLLIVDDEESVRELLAAVLEDDPFDIDTACTGEEGLTKACARDYDLVITDLKMPGLNGAQFCDRLIQVRGQSTPRFLFMTGDVLSSETQRFLDSARSLCMLKPFDIAQARGTVLRALAGGDSPGALGSAARS